MPHPKFKLILDPNLYRLNEEELALLKQLTKINDEDKLKEHVLGIQREAFEICPYPCVRDFNFVKMRISHSPVYKEVISMGRDRKWAILLDIGCCFGNDVRKATADGFPADQIVASDLRPEFWELGNKLFKDDPSSRLITFVPGNILDDNFIAVGERLGFVPQNETHSSSPLKQLRLTDSLNPLAGKVSAIHVSYLFHLFDEEQQLLLARKLATLLSSEPGSIIFGSHIVASVKGVREEDVHGLRQKRFRHSLNSFKELWQKEVPGNGEVIQCDIYDLERQLSVRSDLWLLTWSVKWV